MMVPTFLMTFPNGYILYLGSWHHERHPTMVYEDENEPTTLCAGEQTNQWHWEMAQGTGIGCQKCSSVCQFITENAMHSFTYREFMKNASDFEKNESNQFPIYTCKL